MHHRDTACVGASDSNHRNRTGRAYRQQECYASGTWELNTDHSQEAAISGHSHSIKHGNGHSLSIERGSNGSVILAEDAHTINLVGGLTGYGHTDTAARNVGRAVVHGDQRIGFPIRV